LQRILAKLVVFAILPNSGGFAYFPYKCGGFLELTRRVSLSDLESVTAQHNMLNYISIVMNQIDKSRNARPFIRYDMNKAKDGTEIPIWL
jgi:hypothetical protein